MRLFVQSGGVRKILTVAPDATRAELEERCRAAFDRDQPATMVLDVAPRRSAPVVEEVGSLREDDALLFEAEARAKRPREEEESEEEESDESEEDESEEDESEWDGDASDEESDEESDDESDDESEEEAVSTSSDVDVPESCGSCGHKMHDPTGQLMEWGDDTAAGIDFGARAPCDDCCCGSCGSRKSYPGQEHC